MMDSKLSPIKQAIDRELMDYSYLTLARYLYRQFPQADEADLFLAALVSRQIQQGHVCLECAEIESKSSELGFTRFSSSEWIKRLADSPLVGGADLSKPLVLEIDRLYLVRQYFLESNLANSLVRRADSSDPVSAEVVQLLNQLFPFSEAIDLQKMAALVCLRRRLTLISGGPGTGKTWTVARILALLIARQPGLQIHLAAPTGKAAARLAQSISGIVASLPVDETLRQAIPLKAVTLHRLLGVDRFSHQPRFNRDNPLACDLLIVDEASMIDQQMMAMLCAALEMDARLVLLGDRDQLSSVEAGSVFADLCGNSAQLDYSDEQLGWIKQTLGYSIQSSVHQHILQDCRVVLTTSRRFTADSGIGALASAINQGDADAARRVLLSEDYPDAEWFQIEDRQVDALLIQQALEFCLDIARARTPQQAFSAYGAFQLLCAVWEGPTGVNQVNQLLQQSVRQRLQLGSDTQFYHGQPIIIRRNIPQYELSNGDVGIVLNDAPDKPRVWFESAAGGYRALALSQLPEHDLAYAITVHKSQGSEYDRVVLLLPAKDSAVCTRELLYTAVTRATTRVQLWAGGAVLGNAIQQPTRRSSGLAQRLEQVNIEKSPKKINQDKINQDPGHDTSE
jgi:exodeoxyribonuclease V alpha subunit